MNCKGKILGILVGLACVLNMAGCGRISNEERQKLDENTAQALYYYNEKYGVEEFVKECDYASYDSGLFGVEYNTRYMYYLMSDDYVVIYDVEQGKLLDNRQSGEITEALDNELWPAINGQLGQVTGYDMVLMNADRIQYNWVKVVDDRADEFFGEYYDGDIRKFCKSEEIMMDTNGAHMIIVADDESWRDAGELLLTQLEECFYGYDVFWDVEVYTSELYDKVKLSLDKHKGSLYGSDGYIARIQMSKNFNSPVKEYNVDEPYFIEVASGIYMCSDERDFGFREGDVIWREAYTGEEFQQICDDDLKKRQEATEYANTNDVKYGVNIYAEGPVYKVEFSERVEEYFKDKKYRTLRVVMRIKPGELQGEYSGELCSVKGIYDEIRDIDYKDFYGEKWDEKTCVDISINDNQCFFIGHYESK